jgi:nitroreductase
MSFLSLVRKRRSVRAYKPDPVPEEMLEQVLEAGRLAPSACNFQPWRFIVLQGESEVRRLSKSYGREWFLCAPAVIVVCIDRTVSWKRADGREYGDVDAAIAMDHMILAATECGLGTCWIGAFRDDEARKALSLPDTIDPVVMTPLGYPAVEPEPKPRKDKGQIVRRAAF